MEKEVRGLIITTNFKKKIKKSVGQDPPTDEMQWRKKRKSSVLHGKFYIYIYISRTGSSFTNRAILICQRHMK
jgi:hypothetical protein